MTTLFYYKALLACDVGAYGEYSIAAYTDEEAIQKAKEAFIQTYPLRLTPDLATAHNGRIVTLRRMDHKRDTSEVVANDVKLSPERSTVYYGVWEDKHGTDLLFSRSESDFFAEIARRIRDAAGGLLPDNLDDSQVLAWTDGRDLSPIFTYTYETAKI